MSNCPICDQTRPWNCDCTEREKEAFYHNLDLEERQEQLREKIENLKNIVSIILISTYKPARQVTKEEEAELDAFMRSVKE